MTLQLGLDTFGDVTVDADGRPVPHPQVVRDVVEQGRARRPGRRRRVRHR
ncbi:hypothetical protein [Nocardioides sp. TF02-7]|nr:hypothetical protein [Nocardioides sp. TF02-7]UMG94265.1 hypothetical protein MF408_09745 [Nocardioides sp. TF02-7]